MANSKNNEIVASIREIGCCGAYCKTGLTSFSGSSCRGCKLGYEIRGRNISRAKCKIKACCFWERKFETCADCPDYPACRTIRDFYEKEGHKYKKYKQSIEFIRKNGYGKFIKTAENRKGPYGKLTEFKD
jgi:hypothetical protein